MLVRCREEEGSEHGVDRERLAVTEAEGRMDARCWFWNPFLSA